MKKFYLFFLLLTVFSGNAQIVNIPDANFKAKLLQSSPENQIATNSIGISVKIDANDDGEIQFTEAEIVVVMDISNSNISDLTGIEAFVNLSNLFANNNQLTSITIAGLNDFTFLSVNNNQLTNLSIANTILISGLDASHNQLSSINVTFKQECESLLDLSYNNLTSFTLQNISNLGEYVDLSHNQINEIVLDNVNFLALHLAFNNLSSLQIQNNVSIGTLDISNNLFSSSNIGNFNITVDELRFGNNIVDVIPDGIYALNINYSSNNSIADLSGFTSITDCDPEMIGNMEIGNCPNLETVILKDGFNHTEITCNEGGTIFQNPALNLSINNCPNLSFICVDEAEQPFIQARINQLGLQNQVQVNSYCSFVPGGEYFDIQGLITFDNNSNGCDVDDIQFPNLKFSISDGTNTGTFVANNSGNYQIPVQQGTQTITPVFENPSYFNVSPTLATVAFPSTSSPYTQDFCVTANGVHNDLEIEILPVNIARPGFDATYKIVYKNKGNQISSGTVSLSYNDDLMDLVNTSPVNSSSATNTLSWNYTNLNPFENREIIVVFNINAPTETPAVNNGDVLTFTSNISFDTDETPNDNAFTLTQTVVNSFDPNDKTCLEGTKITPSMVGEYVHYVIRFENTGTFPAENIVVTDVIDTTKFDVNTLIPQHSSHDFYTKINNTTGKVEFIFENINLPFDDATNDGYVAFKIKTMPTLVLGDTFTNSANIYFDYNFPITTNTTTTTVALLGNHDFDFGNYFSLYPNPTKNILTITNNQQISISSLSIYNSIGQLIEVITTPNETIDVSNLQTGIYYLKLITNKGMTTQEFIKK